MCCNIFPFIRRFGKLTEEVHIKDSYWASTLTTGSTYTTLTIFLSSTKTSGLVNWDRQRVSDTLYLVVQAHWQALLLVLFRAFFSKTMEVATNPIRAVHDTWVNNCIIPNFKE